MRMKFKVIVTDDWVMKFPEGKDLGMMAHEERVYEIEIEDLSALVQLSDKYPGMELYPAVSSMWGRHEGYDGVIGI